MKETHSRARLLDELRGLSILLMVVHHAAWDLHHLFGVAVPLLQHPVVTALQGLFAGVFVVISGMVCHASRNNLRRGLQVLACGMAVTAVTLLALPEKAVWFGILHLLGTSILLYALGQKLWRRIPPLAGAAAALIGFSAAWGLPHGFLSFGPMHLFLPDGAYRLPWGFVVGLPAPNFRSGDYFPLLPWGFLFFFGAFLGRPVFQHRRPQWLFPARYPMLAQVGRHSLWVYLLHQPVLYGLMTLLFQP